ncbi:hypothetical protein ABB37_05653 [Leptomonas pyrrhocoris]|uniref:Uncharacterized protein n=1 Tax=Leptomonas pyrrhocoris TaxID=157538 RepID=A0A0M9FZM7_LEPPY|nr:hypothetical protein ABB37_05653 [Leptomonas pyrrhocoris]KPA79146.1 hypothetical protein ABB37_05653 [Leptomonas pyrrhocoris]|eukprot:XP_015657585.1 hypothetical protein ABB37_05653 [Leptomonas pyrrhocoris]
MFPGGYLPDYGTPRGRRTTAVPAPTAISPASPRSANPTTGNANLPNASDVVSVAALPHSPAAATDGHIFAPAGRVDTKFALPPALITCLVRHIDSQHNVLATPAIVEKCLRDLQLRLMPWVPVERVFGSTMRATVPVGASTTSASACQAHKPGDIRPLSSSSPAAGRSSLPNGAVVPGGDPAAPPLPSTPHAGSYLAGSHVHLQLAKTTDNSVATADGASVLHLLFYAVDEPESRPSHLGHVVQEWQEALKAKGEEHDCMVLLVHGDLVAASEAAARMAEEAQHVGGDGPQAAGSVSTARTAASASPPPAPPSSTRPAVLQDKVDAAAAQLRKYYKELHDLKLSPQQVSAYMPNETPMRVVERLRPAVIARGGRLRQSLQIAAARKRQFPQDPSTKPKPFSGLSSPPTAGATPTLSPANNPISSSSPPASSPQPTSSPQRTVSPAAAAAATSPSAARHAAPPSSSSDANARYFNVQALWRTGYDLVVHYLQYGFVFDAREALEHLYLEYYNNSDDYMFLRTPVATLERLGRVPNLFDSHGHGGWEVGRTGYPKALEPGSELLEGLLLLASAEITCSLLLGEAATALRRYNTFVQVTREKFEEWNTSEAQTKSQATPSSASSDKAANAAPTSPQRQQHQQAIEATSGVTSSTYQQFFLLQCYLSGLRMWWPTSGLCRPRKAISSRTSPAPAPTAAAADEPQSSAGKEKQLHGDSAATVPSQRTPRASSTFSPLRLPPLEMASPPDTVKQAALPAPEDGADMDGSVAVALSTSPLLLPNSEDPAAALGIAAPLSSPNFTTTYVTSTASPPLPGAPEEDGGGGGVRYSITNPSFAAPGGTPMSAQSSRRVSSFAGRAEFISADRQGGGATTTTPLLAPASASSNGVRSGERCNSSEEGYNAAQLPLGGEDEEDDSVRFELNYLTAGSEDTVQVSAGYLVELAISTGLVAPSMEPAELSGTAEAIREATEGTNAGLVRELQQRQRQLRRSCAEAASLLERARDSLAAVAHDLGYSPFRRFMNALSFDDEGTGEMYRDKERRASPAAPAATVTAVATSTAFSNIEELSSPAQALRLWRTLTAMAALALHISDQRRREFHLYSRLAVTFLSDHPTVTANIVADRLLPYVKTLGWRHVELFVRRLYVEAREQLMRRVGLFDALMRTSAPTQGDLGHNKNGSSAAATWEEVHKVDSTVWLRIFRTGWAYALYRECILVLIRSGVEDPQDSAASLLLADGDTTGTQQQQQQQQQQYSRRPPASLSGSASSPFGMTSEEGAVGSLGTRLFAYRPKEQWWRELIRVDALVMSTFYANEPPEYPMDHPMSPLMVRLERQRSPAAVTTDDGAMPFSNLAAGALVADVDEMVRVSLIMTSAVNPLVGPDGGLHLRVTSPNTHTSRSAQTVRLQLTLESRKDWADEEEPTHVVHLHDCAEAAYDEVNHQLRAVFLFPVCHAGVYCVRRIRLCNGKTWLVRYPQYGSSTGGSKGRRGCHRGLPMLFSRGGGIPASHASASPASFQPVTRAPVLRVPEPRSSVHLRLTLPSEAHCFADSVDYATLEVDLEDPLPLTLSSGGGQPSSAGAFSKSTDKTGIETATAVGGRGENDDSADEGAECSCFYEASPGNLLLPLSVTAAGASGRHSREPGTSIGEDVMELGSQQRLASVSPGYRALLLNDGAGVAESVVGLADGLRSRGGAPLVAAVVLGTPSLYRQRGTSSSAGPAVEPSRTGPDASLTQLLASRSPDMGAASVGGGLMEGGGAASHRGHASLHPCRNPHRSPSHRATPADGHHSSSARSSSHHPLCASPPLAAAGPPRTSNNSDGNLRYKSAFKPLRVGNTTENNTTAAATAAETVGVKDGALPSPGSNNSARILPPADRPRSKSAHHAAHFHQRTPHRLPHHPRSLAASEPSAHDGGGVGAEDGFARKSRHSFADAAGYLVGLGGAINTAAVRLSSSLQAVDADRLQLLLKHPVKTHKAGEKTASPTPSAKGFSSSSSTSAAAAAAVAYTSVPIHLGVYLNSIPPPELQTHAPSTLSPPEATRATELADTLGPLLQAVANNSATASMDRLRESVIRLLPSHSVLQATSSSVRTSPVTVAGAGDDKAGVARILVSQMRLRVPLLPLLVTPAATAPVKSAEEATRDLNPPHGNNSSSNIPAPPSSPSSSSSAEVAKQARITFTCMRGREPSTTSLSTVIPFQLAISCDYAFKHFQGRVYCLVRMKNLLKTTSLWMRGAVLTVLDPEPSYEIVRVCDVYEQLLATEWKPQEELSILYELDLIASFHPVQPECAHQVQMKVFYSSWVKSFLAMPAEDRLVLRPETLPSTEATAESVELIHGEEEGNGHASSAPTTALPLRRSSTERDPDDFLCALKSEPNGEDNNDPLSARTPAPGGNAAGSSLATTLAHTAAGAQGGHRVSTTVTSGFSDHSEGSVTHSATQVAHSSPTNFSPKSEDGADTSSRSRSSGTTSGAVHFNVLILRQLEETCNSVVGPVATFHSKHLCVFNIVMYAESPWTMRFGAATNYVARAPTPPLSRTASTISKESWGGSPLRSSAQPARMAHPHHHRPPSIFSSAPTGAAAGGFSGNYTGTNNPTTADTDSFFGNAIVDQPADFVFVAGEPVRFCVRLQPLAQNWPEDANMEETFFIRLTYNPEEWMVIGKQRDRRTLSLMEEVTVYFNAVPLLPRNAADVNADTQRFPRSNAVDEDEQDEEGGEGNASLLFVEEGEKGGGATGAAPSSRHLAGHAVRDEGILQTPTVEMFWERKKSAAGTTATDDASTAAHHRFDSQTPAAAAPSAYEDAVMGEAVLIDVVQFRTWVRVRKHSH